MQKPNCHALMGACVLFYEAILYTIIGCVSSTTSDQALTRLLCLAVTVPRAWGP